MGISKRIRHMNRYRKITSILARNGLVFFSNKMGKEERLFQGEQQTGSLGYRVRLILEELGTTFIKLGQVASTRPDLLPEEIILELKELQDQVPSFSFEEAKGILEEELACSLNEVFRSFEETPLAAASIGQVHQAELLDGTKVVVKIQRPNIQTLIETDLEIIADLARIAENTLEWASRYQLREIVDELAKGLLLELDFSLEARNMEKFQKENKKLGYVVIPSCYWEYSTKRVITMDYIQGIKLSDSKQLEHIGIENTVLAERISSTILYQVLEVGHFHADLHPGNVLALPDGKIALLDFGMVGQLPSYMRKNVASFVIALKNKSTKGIIRAISDLGMIPAEINQAKLNADVEAMREKYYHISFHDLSMGEAIHDLFQLAFLHKIKIPSELTLLGKALITVEGVVAELDPNFSVFDMAEPFGKKLLLDRFNPWMRMKTLLEDIPDYYYSLKDIPTTMKQFSTSIKKGKIKVEIHSPQLDTLMKKVDRFSNQIAFSIVLLALSIVMVGLIIGVALSGVNTVLWKFPIIEIGFGIAVLMVIWLIFSIFKSGRF